MTNRCGCYFDLYQLGNSTRQAEPDEAFHFFIPDSASPVFLPNFQDKLYDHGRVLRCPVKRVLLEIILNSHLQTWYQSSFIDKLLLGPVRVWKIDA
jgi:hypothetical protein